MLGVQADLTGAAPPPFVPCNAEKIGERRRGRDAEPRRAPDAVHHDEHGIGNVVFRDRDAATTAGSDEANRAAAESVKC
jgi:hypothetical protein